LGYASVEGDEFSNFYLQDGDILMSHINSVSHLGKVAIYKNRKEKIIHGMNLLCLKANPEI
jgi:type I restriction enzyme, S subunit